MPIRVPDVTGLRARAAAKLLREAGLVPGAIRSSLSREHEVGVVTGQLPPAGSAIEQGSEVTLIVSAGKVTPRGPRQPRGRHPNAQIGFESIPSRRRGSPASFSRRKND